MSLTSPNFGSILDESPTEIVYALPLPDGTYLCTVGKWEDGKTETGPLGQFRLMPISPLEDVPMNQFEEVGGCEGKLLYRSFWSDRPEELDEFHSHCGLDLLERASRRDRNSLVEGLQVLAYVKRRPNRNNPAKIETIVTRTAPAT